MQKVYFQKLLLLGVSTLLSSCSFICNGGWSSADTALELAGQASLIADYDQTERVARNPEKYIETNARLGEHPTPNKVTQYFIGGSIIHAAVSCSLPKTWRTIWQSYTLGVEVNAIQTNHYIGL